MTSTLPCRTNEGSGRALSRDDGCEITNNDVQGRSLDGEPGAEVRNSGLGEESSDEDSELEGLDWGLAGEGRVEVRPFEQRRQKGCKPGTLEKKANQRLLLRSSVESFSRGWPHLRETHDAVETLGVVLEDLAQPDDALVEPLVHVLVGTPRLPPTARGRFGSHFLDVSSGGRVEVGDRVTK